MKKKKETLMTGARIVVETLLEQNVREVFGYPGSTVLDLYDELYRVRDRLHHVLTAHEQGAAHAADGYARTTGKVGVVLATSGPGATNLVTGIATAMLDSVPMVAITGNVASSMIGRDSFQEVDITGVTLPITKHNFLVQDVRELADIIREAFAIAQSGRPGPVLVDIPKDVQTAVCAFEAKPPVQKEQLAPVSDALLQQAAALLNKAERPYIYIGGGALGNDLGGLVLTLAEKIDAYIGSSLMGLGTVPTAAPRFLGMQGMHGRFASSVANREADLIFGIGVRFSDRATGSVGRFAQGAKLVQLDVDPSEINKNVIVDVGMVGDMKNALERLSALLDTQEHPAWTARVDALRQTENEHLQAAKSAYRTDLNPQTIFEVINATKTPQTVLATDVGQHQMWTAQYAALTEPHRFVTSGGLGTMGYGLGAAIGACVGTKKKTVLLTGDGSFGMNLNELATAVSERLPVVVMIFNNRVLGMVHQWQRLFYGKRYAGTKLHARQTDFIKLAEAFGAKGCRVETLDAFKAAFREAMQSDEPYLIDAKIDEDALVLPMMPPSGGANDLITELKEGE